MCNHGTDGCGNINIYIISLAAWQRVFQETSRRTFRVGCFIYFLFVCFLFFLCSLVGLAPCRSDFGAKSVVRYSFRGGGSLFQVRAAFYFRPCVIAHVHSATRKNTGCDDRNLNAQVSRFSFAETERECVFEGSRRWLP